MASRVTGETDERLARRASAGDVEAYGELVSRYERFVLRILWSRGSWSPEDAEELAQDTFLRAWKRLDTYDDARPFRSWLARIAVNISIDRYRADARRPDTAVLETLEPTLADDEPDPARAVEERQARRELLAHVQQLPEHYRQAIVLRFLEDLSYEEIADVLEIPLGSVKTRIFRGREALKERLGATASVGGAR